MKAWVQAAVDVDEMNRALEITRMAACCGAEWIEVGTPLLFRYGFDAIRQLKDAAGKSKLVADYKFPYAPVFVAQAARAGADFVTVEDCYSDELASLAIAMGEEHGIGIIMTLLSNNPADVSERAARLEELGAEYFFIRRQVSYQGRTYPTLKDTRAAVRGKIGVTDDVFTSALESVDEGADWIIFGRSLMPADPAICRQWIDGIHGRR